MHLKLKLKALVKSQHYWLLKLSKSRLRLCRLKYKRKTRKNLLYLCSPNNRSLSAFQVLSSSLKKWKWSQWHFLVISVSLNSKNRQRLIKCSRNLQRWHRIKCLNNLVAHRCNYRSQWKLNKSKILKNKNHHLWQTWQAQIHLLLRVKIYSQETSLQPPLSSSLKNLKVWLYLASSSRMKD